MVTDRFGDVELDVPRRVLRRNGQVVHLEPQAFDLLAVLFEHRDRVVSKIELFDGVWGHRFLSEANLTTRVKEIRRALGDDGVQQHTIRNVRGRGYQFVAEVVASAMHDRTGELIGRASELDAIRRALLPGRVVTVTGPGGVGKSSLARAMARQLAPSLTDGAGIVELAVLDADDLVLHSVARALDVVLEQDHRAAAIRSIAERDALLVLDNCEHVIDEVAALVDEVCGLGDARLRLLATSQVRLGVSVEQVVAVHPLAVDEATELFTTRALAGNPNWDPQHAGRERIAALVASLDQLPLTVEMAAARLGSMTFDELERSIGPGASMPMTHRSPIRRHRSLDSLVSWSANLLDAPLRRTFTELSVFAGAFTADETTAVVGADGRSVVFELAELAERSLLVSIGDGSVTRFRMLATVRGVAVRWLEESGREHEVRGRHAAHVAALMRSIDRGIRGPMEARSRAHLNAIVAEVRAAHRWARVNDPDTAAEISGSLHLAAYSTFWNEPVEWSRLLLAGQPDAAPDALIGARLALAGAAANRGDLIEARRAATAATSSADPRVRAMAYEILSDVAVYDGRLDDVTRLTAEMRDLGVALDDPHSIAVAAVNDAIAKAFGGDGVGALRRLDEVDLDSLAPSDQAWIVYARGEALSAAGSEQAASTFADAIDRALDIGNPFVESVARVSLATELARSGRFSEALDAYATSLNAYARDGNYVHAVTTLRNLVETLVAIGDDDSAIVLATATTTDHLRPSYGAEAIRLSTVVAEIESRVDPNRFRERCAEGRRLDVIDAVRAAGAMIDRHRDRHGAPSSADPQAISEQA